MSGCAVRKYFIKKFAVPKVCTLRAPVRHGNRIFVAKPHFVAEIFIYEPSTGLKRISALY
jgi:hypothetical protein